MNGKNVDYLQDMTIQSIIQVIERFAPPAYQESYDNAGLLFGNPDWEARASSSRWTLRKR